MAITISPKFLTVNGKRAAVRYDAGPWIEGVDPRMVKIRPRNRSFPQEFRAAFTVENNSDSREDYFEADAIKVLPGHPLYAEVRAMAIL